MKSLNEFIIESTVKKSKYEQPDTYGELGKKWFDKCKDFATAGNMHYTKYGINDFNGFLDDMDKEFEAPEPNNFYNKISNVRWKMCKALKDKDLNTFIKIAEENNIENFTYGAYLNNRVYGSYLLDTYMLFSVYEYILDGNIVIRNRVMNSLWNIESTLNDNWYNIFINVVNKLKKEIHG